MKRASVKKSRPHAPTDASRYNDSLRQIGTLDEVRIQWRRTSDPVLIHDDLSVEQCRLLSYDAFLAYVRAQFWGGGVETYSWYLCHGARYEASGRFTLRPEDVRKVAPEDGTAQDTAREIGEECDALKAMLLAKNKMYGDSALDPVRIFSRASVEEQILVRLDDKLSRLKRGQDAGEDTIQDVMGYLVLLRIQRRRAR